MTVSDELVARLAFFFLFRVASWSDNGTDRSEPVMLNPDLNTHGSLLEERAAVLPVLARWTKMGEAVLLCRAVLTTLLSAL